MVAPIEVSEDVGEAPIATKSRMSLLNPLLYVMLQTLLNLFVFGPQAAVETPRLGSDSPPNSFEPHNYHLGLPKMQSRIDPQVSDILTGTGLRTAW
jgi:hypothetical protein